MADYAMIGVAGRRLRVAQWHAGKSAWRPLLLLNGIGMNIELLEPVAQAMPERHVICFDMPGIGRSPAPIFPYTVPQMALTTASLLDRLGVESVDLLGISWGGALAQQFAFQHRAHTGRVILAATTAGAAMVPGDLTMLRHLADPMEYTVERTLKRNLASLYNGGGNSIVSLNAAIAPTPLGWAYQLASFGAWTSTPFLPLLDMPVLIMGDDDDKIVPPSNIQYLHNAIPHSRLEMFSGGGHLFMLSQQDKFVATVRAFLDQDRKDD
jgi:pimeloyl-ACP methyl ester carboxylesterase